MSSGGMFRRSRFKGGVEEVNNVMVADETHNLRLKQHRLLRVVKQQLMRTEHSEYADIFTA